MSEFEALKLNQNGFVITYGDGWIKKEFRGTTETIYYAIAGFDISDPFVQAVMSRP